MKIMLEIHDGLIEDLINCKKLNKKYNRDFRKWGLKNLITEALIEFKNKYS